MVKEIIKEFIPRSWPHDNIRMLYQSKKIVPEDKLSLVLKNNAKIHLVNSSIPNNTPLPPQTRRAERRNQNAPYVVRNNASNRLSTCLILSRNIKERYICDSDTN